jgi:hypothetical protein
MNDEYLWTGTGQPDPDVELLERALRPYGHRPQALRLPVARRSRWLGLAILCVTSFVVSVFAWAHAHPSPDRPSPTVEALFRSYDAGHVDGSD